MQAAEAGTTNEFAVFLNRGLRNWNFARRVVNMGRRRLPGTFPRKVELRPTRSFLPQEPTLVKPSSRITRRTLLKQAAAAGVGAVALPQIVPSSVFGADAPSNKLNIAMLACGGRARDNLRGCMGSENIVAICDVDQRQVAEAKKELAKIGAGRQGQGLRGLPQAAGRGEVGRRGGDRAGPALARRR